MIFVENKVNLNSKQKRIKVSMDFYGIYFSTAILTQLYSNQILKKFLKLIYVIYFMNKHFKIYSNFFFLLSHEK